MAADEKKNPVVENYIAKTREETKKALLDSLGMYTTEREYSPTGHFSREYPHYDSTEGVNKYYRETKRIYPEIDDETFEKLQKVIREKDELTPKPPVIEVKKEVPPLEFNIKPTNQMNSGFAAKFMIVIAWIIWIGGLAMALISAGAGKMTGYQVKASIEWLTFFTVFVPYFVGGCLAMCMSELFKNISAIANRVAGYIVRETKQTK